MYDGILNVGVMFTQTKFTDKRSKYFLDSLSFSFIWEKRIFCNIKRDICGICAVKKFVVKLFCFIAFQNYVNVVDVCCRCNDNERIIMIVADYESYIMPQKIPFSTMYYDVISVKPLKSKYRTYYIFITITSILYIL